MIRNMLTILAVILGTAGFGFSMMAVHKAELATSAAEARTIIQRDPDDRRRGERALPQKREIWI